MENAFAANQPRPDALQEGVLMADAGNGVSGSDSSRNASDPAQRSAETAAAQQAQAAADKAAADAAAVDPVQAAPVDLSLSPATISQLSAMPVDTVPNLASFPTPGGVPTAATYADIAQKPAVPASIETNVWSSSFSITPNDPAAVAKAALSDVSVNIGLNYVGDLNANIEARMGIAPAQVTFAGAVSYTNGVTSYGLSGVAGPFGGVADPNYGLTADFAKQLDFGKLEASLNLNVSPDGFTNGRVAAGFTAPLSDNWDGYARVGVGFDRNGVTSIDSAIGADYNTGGASLGVSGRVDTRTRDVSGGAKFNLGIKF
ncbi:hypothetical protein [Lysobacter enzymogenes]|nr:hypothetical protein [Lysobacter enzymogenes]